MIIRSGTRVGSILGRHDDAADTFSWYGVRNPLEYAHLSLGELCEQLDIELDDLLYDLKAMGDDEDDDEDEDDWDDDDWDDEVADEDFDDVEDDDEGEEDELD
jgi:hypothetical protein